MIILSYFKFFKVPKQLRNFTCCFNNLSLKFLIKILVSNNQKTIKIITGIPASLATLIP